MTRAQTKSKQRTRSTKKGNVPQRVITGKSQNQRSGSNGLQQGTNPRTAAIFRR
jgi:hypothetical protein